MQSKLPHRSTTDMEHALLHFFTHIPPSEYASATWWTQRWSSSFPSTKGGQRQSRGTPSWSERRRRLLEISLCASSVPVARVGSPSPRSTTATRRRWRRQSSAAASSKTRSQRHSYGRVAVIRCGRKDVRSVLRTWHKVCFSSQNQNVNKCKQLEPDRRWDFCNTN